MAAFSPPCAPLDLLSTNSVPQHASNSSKGLAAAKTTARQLIHLGQQTRNLSNEHLQPLGIDCEALDDPDKILESFDEAQLNKTMDGVDAWRDCGLPVSSDSDSHETAYNITMQTSDLLCDFLRCPSREDGRTVTDQFGSWTLESYDSRSKY